MQRLYIAGWCYRSSVYTSEKTKVKSVSLMTRRLSMLLKLGDLHQLKQGFLTNQQMSFIISDLRLILYLKSYSWSSAHEYLFMFNQMTMSNV